MEPLVLLVARYLTLLDDHLRVGFWLPQHSIVIGFWTFYNIPKITYMASPICVNNMVDMASSQTMVVNMVGQLVDGITFAYEL